MPYKDLEKQRAAKRKYAKSKKGKATRQRWLEAHEDELAKKREEKAMERRVAFWEKALRRDGELPRSRIYNVIRLWHMRKRGEDIDFDPHNAKYVYEWENKGRFEEKPRRSSVQSLDYY